MRLELETILNEGCNLPDDKRALLFSEHISTMQKVLGINKDTLFMLYFVKPDAVQSEISVINRTLELSKEKLQIIPNSRLEVQGKNGIMIYEGKEYQADINGLLERHYTPTIGGKPFFSDYISQMTSQIVAYILKIPNVKPENQNQKIQEFRKDVVGPTDCIAAKKALQKYGIRTIRAEFGTDKNTNAVHCSDSMTESTREIMNIYSPVFKKN